MFFKLLRLITIICGAALVCFAQGPNAGKVPEPRTKSPSTGGASTVSGGKRNTSKKETKSARNRIQTVTKVRRPPVSNARLNLHIGLPDVKVTLNDIRHERPDESGPFMLVGLRSGTHTAVIEKVGYRTEIRTIRLSAGERKSLTIDLVPTGGVLNVAPNISGAVIKINDLTFTGEIKGLVVAPGTHLFTVSKPGYKTATYSIEIVAGETNTQIVILQLLR